MKTKEAWAQMPVKVAAAYSAKKARKSTRDNGDLTDNAFDESPSTFFVPFPAIDHNIYI